MHDHRVAKRYAQALYQEALRNEVVESVESDLGAISNLLHSGEEFRDFLLSPHVSREEKGNISERLFSDRVTALTMQFLRLLLDKRREGEFDAIRLEFIALRREHGHIIYAEVISAEALSNEQRTAIERKLSDSTKKKVEAAYDVDPALIGGVKVVYGNYVLDGTIKGSLRRLRDTLRRDLLKQL